MIHLCDWDIKYNQWAQQCCHLCGCVDVFDVFDEVPKTDDPKQLGQTVNMNQGVGWRNTGFMVSARSLPSHELSYRPIWIHVYHVCICIYTYSIYNECTYKYKYKYIYIYIYISILIYTYIYIYIYMYIYIYICINCKPMCISADIDASMVNSSWFTINFAI